MQPYARREEAGEPASAATGRERRRRADDERAREERPEEPLPRVERVAERGREGVPDVREQVQPRRLATA